MNFNSVSFFIFLPIVFLLLMLVDGRYRWVFLLVASYLFYGFLGNSNLLAILSAVTLITYYFGRKIAECQDDEGRCRLLKWGVWANLLFLIYFKCLSFFIFNLNSIFKLIHADIFFDAPPDQITTGISFFVFSAISYLVDVYYRMQTAERHLGYFALYLAFFPKLLSGPIERAGNLLPQLKEKLSFNYDNIRAGVLLFMWGMFKKVVVAERLSVYVAMVYDNLRAYKGAPILLASYAHTFQLYMDFSGYTDMALGVALLFNIKLMQNFNAPFLARSMPDFWRRWHISLSTWLLNYIFEPLQMKFRHWGKAGTLVALSLAFVVVGIWHGVKWTYLTFGIIHAVYICGSFLYKPYQKKIHKSLRLENTAILKIWQIFFVYNLVTFSLIFSRATNMRDAWYVINNMLAESAGMEKLLAKLANKEMIIFGIIFLILATTAALTNNKKINGLFKANYLFRRTIYLFLPLAIILFASAKSSDFVYFNF